MPDDGSFIFSLDKMLNPTSAAQKNLSEEDSSGSEAGSEVSLEPETDRFGFILTNGSTAGSVGPSPELVRQREAKWINIIGQWDRILLKKSSKVKVQCQKGIPASLRAKCWPLLCGATDRMKQNNELYKSLDSQPGLQSWADVIERDLDRQFPFHEMFLSKDGHGQRGLFRVLKAYTQYQPEEGYCQAQGPVAAVLLMNMPAEEAFWCLVQISEQYLPGYYNPLLEGVLFDAAVLTWVLKKTCPAAHKHLQHHGVEPLMFATDWLMCLFTRHLPFNTLLRVWDLFFCYGVRVLLQVAVVLVRRVLGRPEQRKLCQGQMETLERLRGVREEVQEEDDSFIAEVCSVPLSAKDLEKQTEKELEKWRKDKPSSTFDPRGRCQGYRMAWARARLNKEEQDRKEREKGNLSVPLARSASTLSLSPSLLHKRWRKGGKGNAGEREGGNRVVRHLSMGAKEDWRNWSDFDFKKVQGVQEEDAVAEGHKTQSEVKLTEQSEQQKLLQEPEKMDKEEKVKEQVENVETRGTEMEESQCKETEESKILSEQKEETNLCPAEHQTVENIPQATEQRTSQCEQEEKLDTAKETQVLEEESHNSEDQETEVEDTNEETEERAGESEHAAAAVDNHIKVPREAEADANTEVEQLSADSGVEQWPQSDIKPEESTETDSVQQVQVDIVVTDVSETRSETSTDSGSDGDLVTQQKKEEVITEIDDAVEGKHHSTESLVETDTIEEFNTDTKTEADEETREEAEVNEAKQDEMDEMKVEIIQKDSEELTDTEKESKLETDVLEETREEMEDNEAKQDEMKSEVTDSEKESKTEADVMEETQEETEVNEAKQDEMDEMKVEIIQTDSEELTDTEKESKTEADVMEETREETEVNEAKQDEMMAEILQKDSEGLTDTEKESKLETDVLEETREEMEDNEAKRDEMKAEVTDSEKESKTEADVMEETREETEVNEAKQDEMMAEIIQKDSEELTDTEKESKTEEEPLTKLSLEHIQQKQGTGLVADSETEAEISFAKDTAEESSEIISFEPTQEKEEMILTGQAEAQVEGGACVCGQTDAEETQTENQLNEEAADAVTQAEAPNETTEPDVQSSVQTETSGMQTPEQPTSQVTVGPVKEEDRTKNVDGDDVFISPKPTDDPCKDSHQSVPSSSSMGQTSGPRSSRSSGDFCVRKSSSSRGSRLARRLSEDLFTTPQKTSQSQAGPDHPEVKHPESGSNPGAANPTQTAPDVTLSEEVKEDAVVQHKPPPQRDPPKRFGLFRRLRGEQPKNTKAQGTPKMQVPKILIQDFSDGAGIPIEEEAEDKLSSRERRRRRRERERREKEEEKLKKKREKELEKERERERRKPQTRGKSFQVQKEKGSADVAHAAKTGSQQLKNSTFYAESYF